MSSKTAAEFSRIGKRLFAEHLVGGNFGNMSVLTPEGYFITRTGSYLDADPAEIVLMPRNGRMTPGASSEWRVHTAVYNATEHEAIVHAHPQHAVALSLLYDSIRTVDSEGQLFASEI
ncbi:MAG: class II aldolase/adducin family protein, partial [Methanocorpusculum sp.]|nr:class II aldolase/adducin family protein [Methanocorpusculum sp.]